MIDDPGLDLSKNSVKLEMNATDVESNVVNLEVESVVVSREHVETHSGAGGVESEALGDGDDQINDTFSFKFNFEIIGFEVDVTFFDVGLSILVSDSRIRDADILEFNVFISEGRERDVLDSSDNEVEESVLDLVDS